MNRHILEKFNDIILDFLKDEKERPVLPYVSPVELEQQFELAIPDAGKGLDGVLEMLRTVALHTPKTASERFFNQLFGGRIPAATLADMLASVLNNSMYTYKVGGIHILIEQVVIRRMAALVGFSDGDGIITPGGSISNLIAMIAARNECNPTIRTDGFDGRKYILYSSEESHYSIRKNANFVGIGSHNVRLIPADKSGKMNVEKLESQIVKDIAAGFVPFFINATAGTTVLGAFDPLNSLADVAEKYKIWWHVDGAWGGSLLLSAQSRGKLSGCERADSFTWDAHKIMGVPLLASAILIRRKGVLKTHFSETAEYLFQSDEVHYNPGIKSIQCGRRNDALKVWAAWQYYGEAGYEARVNRQLELTAYTTAQVQANPQLELCLEPEALNVCFFVKNRCAEKVCEYLYKKGLSKVSYGHYKGKACIRLICVDPDMSFEDIDRFFASLEQAIADQS